ncbi:hypothetical protein EAF00_012038 [Botryotinia globosa]|nr:hypothetical protein EAF00_012038 [Botryotinia globosa]
MHSTETTTPHAHHDTRPSEAHFATTFDRFEGDGYMTQVGFWPKIGSHMETKQKPSPRYQILQRPKSTRNSSIMVHMLEWQVTFVSLSMHIRNEDANSMPTHARRAY